MSPGFATLGTRNRQPELMDQPGLDETLHRHALRSLARVNWISGTSGILWGPIRKLAHELPPDQRLRVLDVACGGGDVAIGLARRARRARIGVEIDGCDISDVAIEHARRAAQRHALDNVRFFRQDVLEGPLPDGYDAVTCSLFLHHLSNGQAAGALQSMSRAAGKLVVVSDLRRTWMGYALAWIGSRLLTRSPVVHVDGPLSVAAAFTLPEAQNLVGQSGLSGAVISRRWPQRFLVVWRKPA